MNGWIVENGTGDVEVNSSGLYIEGEFLPDQPTTEGATHD